MKLTGSKLTPSQFTRLHILWETEINLIRHQSKLEHYTRNWTSKVLITRVSKISKWNLQPHKTSIKSNFEKRKYVTYLVMFPFSQKGNMQTKDLFYCFLWKSRSSGTCSMTVTVSIIQTPRSWTSRQPESKALSLFLVFILPPITWYFETFNKCFTWRLKFYVVHIYFRTHKIVWNLVKQVRLVIKINICYAKNRQRKKKPQQPILSSHV